MNHSTTTELYVYGSLYNDLLVQHFNALKAHEAEVGKLQAFRRADLEMFKMVVVQRNELEVIRHKQALQISQLADELGKLRPPAKFKVKQILVRRDCEASFTVRHSRFCAGQWFYSNSREDNPIFPAYWQRETTLRAQNIEEKG